MFKNYLHLMLVRTLTGTEQSTAAEREKKIFLMLINNEKHQMYNSKNLCRLEVLCFFIVFLQIKSKITAKKILCGINR